jgi:hypothetical protein
MVVPRQKGIFNWKPVPAPEPGTAGAEQTLAATQAMEDRQVIVHCHFYAFPGSMIRIWKTTYLHPAGFPEVRSRLLHAENISYAPVWTRFKKWGIHTFTLIFEGLPEGCLTFDLSEETEGSGRFFVPGILRTDSDVYHLPL